MEGEGGEGSSSNPSSSSILDFLRRNCSDAEFLVIDGSGSSERRKGNNQVAESGGTECEFPGAPARITPADPVRCAADAAMKLQKFYRSYRTRRMLADSAVIAEELWWQALDFARLNHRTISFFNFMKPETAASKWNRVGLNASKVGKGLSEDAKAQKLAFQHWIEAIDPRHRYGHNLHYYYDEWCKTSGGQPFFYWLDIGDGKEVDLKDCPRSKLRQHCIKYLGPIERKHYEFEVLEGKILHKLTGKPLDTNDNASAGSKWIFVMSASQRFYAGQKQKGLFHHSSFLAGGATLAAGRLMAEDGVLQCISAYSGHYRPSDDSLDTFLLYLKENGVDLDQVQIQKANEDYYENGETGNLLRDEAMTGGVFFISESLHNEENGQISDTTEVPKPNYKRTLSGGLQSPKANMPKTSILQKINSKTAAQSYQLGHQLSTKWSTGAGPRIGCIGDYPMELRLQALEFTKISPQTSNSLLSTTITELAPSPACQ